MEACEDSEAMNAENIALCRAKYEEGEKLLEIVSHFSTVGGKTKLERRICAELKFLRKLKSSACMKKEHLLSSNIVSLSAIVGILKTCGEPVAVLQPFPLENGSTNRIEVDVIGDGGSTWYKAVARKAEAISQICKGKTSSSQKSVIEQAKCYLKCAEEHPHHFRAPRVIFSFANNVSRTLASQLNHLGVRVEGELIDLEESSEEEDSDDSEEYDHDESSSSDTSETLNQEIPSTSNRLFLDITCMVAYVSSMTNGGANYIFPKAIYNQQVKSSSTPLNWKKKYFSDYY